VTAAATLKLGPQPDGSALLALWLAPPRDRHPPALADIGLLPDGAALAVVSDGCAPPEVLPPTGRAAHDWHVFRVPMGSCIGVDEDLLFAGRGVSVKHRGALHGFDGSPIADLPARWLTWLVSQCAMAGVDMISRGEA
jgi:hypothetical protein